jgi:hypothetical protein
MRFRTPCDEQVRVPALFALTTMLAIVGRHRLPWRCR